MSSGVIFGESVVGSKVIRNITKILKSASGVLYGRVTAGTGRGEEITFASIPALIGVYTTAQVDSIIGGIEGLTSADIDTLAEINAILTDADLASVSYVDNGLSGKQATLVSGTNIKTVNSTSLLGSGDITVGLSGTGSVDNAALRADGTGGATLQSSAWIITDNYTASPNNTVNHASLQATGGTTNVSVSIVPKGTGAFSLHVPDGTSAGGNARGDYATDLQTLRTAATQVASGANSFAANRQNTVSGTSSYVFGMGCSVTGNSAGAFGEFTNTTGRASNSFGGYNTVSGTTAGCSGNQITVSSVGGWATGNDANCDLLNQVVVGAKRFAILGDCQSTLGVPIKSATTDATPTEMLTQEAFYNATGRLTLRNNSAWVFEISVIARSTSGANHAAFVRRGVIYRNGNAASTSLEGSVQTVGTDIASAGASTWAVAVTADTTNGSLKVEFTGQAATSIRATGSVRMAEVGFA